MSDVLFEAGYSVDTIDDIAAKAKEGSENSPNSTIDIEPCVSSSGSVIENALHVSKGIRVQNVNKIVIGTLNINSLAPKLDQLCEVIGKNLDILTIKETKLDSSFPSQQFMLPGYSEPYRLNRNREGGGKMNAKINHIHERALIRLVYQDYTTAFDDLLKKDSILTIHHRNMYTTGCN